MHILHDPAIHYLLEIYPRKTLTHKYQNTCTRMYSLTWWAQDSELTLKCLIKNHTTYSSSKINMYGAHK